MKISRLLDKREIVFVRTTITGLDRGWDPSDVARLLADCGAKTDVCTIDTPEELLESTSRSPNSLFWPCCYNLSRDASRKFLSKRLSDLGVAYVGASPDSLVFTSKIRLKEAIDSIPQVKTPSYVVLGEHPGNPLMMRPLDFPAMLKTEYSCNSEGVRKVGSYQEMESVADELWRLYGQRIFFEAWERKVEFTTAFISKTQSFPQRIAPVRMNILSGASFIDVETKASSHLVGIKRPGDEDLASVRRSVEALTTALSIDGYCRIDLVQNDGRELFVIDINFLPYLSLAPERKSYFPNALLTTECVPFEVQIYQILEHAIERAQSKMRNKP